MDAIVEDGLSEPEQLYNVCKTRPLGCCSTVENSLSNNS